MNAHPMPRSCSDERGFALAALIIFVTALSIVLAASVPVYRVQAQRELEEELIFRGQEYVRAIQKYQRQIGIYPPSIDALIETNGIRYLRRAYTDPITGESFRLLTVNPDGTINGSTLLQPGANPELFQGGTPQIFGAAGASQGGGGPRDNARGGADGSGGFQGGPGFGQQQGFGPGGSGATNFGQAIAPNGAGAGAAGGFGQAGRGGGGTNFGQPIAPIGGGFGAPGGFEQAGRGGGGLTGQTQQGAGEEGRFEQGGGGAGASPPIASGGVVGVAPTNEGPSLKVYNQRAMYSEWEFIAIPGFGTIPASTSVPGQVPGQPAGQPPGFQGDQPSPFSGGQPNPFNP